MPSNDIKSENYINLQGWMVTDLKLKGNELIVYACIYGFSQAENQVFSGNLQYLANWTNSTKQGIIKVIKSLVEKGLIAKTEKVINGVKFCEYHSTKFNGGIKQSLTGGIKQSLPNNIVTNILNDNKCIERKKESKYNDVLSSITDTELKDLYVEYIKMRKLIKSPMTDRALTMLIDKVKKLEPNSVDNQKEMLKEAIQRNWKSVYPLKNKSEPTQTGYTAPDDDGGFW